jgi:hypothetical protein
LYKKNDARFGAADGFVVQTGDPDGPSEGFVDPNTGKLRTIPLEIKVIGDKLPIYGATLEVRSYTSQRQAAANENQGDSRQGKKSQVS